MSRGGGIAAAGWFLAFAYAATHSENAAAGVVVLGIVVALFTAGRN